MKKVIIPLVFFLSGCSGESVQVEKSIKRDLSGMTVSEISHTDTTSTLSWSVPASYEAITASVRADNATEVKLPILPKKIFVIAVFYAREGGQFLFSDQSKTAILSPGQVYTFTKEIDIPRETAVKIGYWEATIGPAE